jgi:hypothetical protein
MKFRNAELNSQDEIGVGSSFARKAFAESHDGRSPSYEGGLFMRHNLGHDQ